MAAPSRGATVTAILVLAAVLGACAAAPTASIAVPAPTSAGAASTDRGTSAAGSGLTLAGPSGTAPGSVTGPSGPGSGPAATDDSSPGPAASPVAGRATGPGAPPVPAGKALSREVFAFVNWFSLPAVEQTIDHDALTTIAFFSIDVDRDGRLVKGSRSAPTAAWTAWTGDRMSRIIDGAHAAGTRVVLSVTRFAWDRPGSRETVALLTRASARKRLAHELASAVRERGVDGVNVDLEPVPQGQRDDFTLLMREVRSALDAVRPGLELTFASTGFSDEYDLPALLSPAAADAIFIMGYQYRGPWSKFAGDVAPLTGPGFGVRQTLDEFLADTTPDRIILGVPYYGWQWQTETSQIHGRTLPANDRNGRSRPVYYEEAAQLAEKLGSTYDEEEGSARVVYRARACPGCPLVWRQLYFDDTRSLQQRYRYIAERGLRGAGVWALGFEGSRSAELYGVLREVFGTQR